MDKYKINLFLLDEKGNQSYLFDIKDDFFNKEEEFSNIDIKCELLLEKKGENFKLDIIINGEVDLLCDLTNKKFRKKIFYKTKFIIRFGNCFDDEDLEVIILPRGNAEIEVRKYIYESIIFSIPVKKEHPEFEDESVRLEYYKKLDKINYIDNKEEEYKEKNPFESLKK